VEATVIRPFETDISAMPIVIKRDLNLLRQDRPRTKDGLLFDRGQLAGLPVKTLIGK